MSRITVLGMDPAFANFGLALVEVDLATKELHPQELHLIRTKKETNKQVRASSSHLRRAEEISAIVRQWEGRANLAAAEIPAGAKSAQAAYGFGVAVGVIGGHGVPLIEVNAAEAKKAATGKKTATKPEMIAWATGLWPDLNWLTHRGKHVDANEHLADAIAIVKAATETPQFEQAAAMMASMLMAAE